MQSDGRLEKDEVGFFAPGCEPPGFGEQFEDLFGVSPELAKAWDLFGEPESCHNRD